MNQPPKTALIPVIELSPYDFKKTNRSSPQKNPIEAPEEWEVYNKQCYADSGLNDILSIEAGSWLFEVAGLSDDSLKIVLKQLYDSTLENFDSIAEIVNNPIDYAPFISGGYLFVINGKILSQPGCCSGLETITEWKEAIKNDAKTEIWTGHDKKGIVHIQAIDTQLKIWIDEEVFWLEKNDYSETIEKAIQIIDVFIERTGELLNTLFNIEKGHILSKAMIY